MGKIISNGIEYSGIQGTTVIANPESSPTDELSSIQIGNDIYSISGGSGSSQKVLQMKTKTYIGDGTIPLVVTFDEVPKCIYSIYGSGLSSTKVRINPFVYGEERFTGFYIYSDMAGGSIFSQVSYSNDNKTMAITSIAPTDVGANWNVSGETYTITYFVEVNSGGGGSASWKDITGTLTAGQTSISFIDSSISESSTFDFYTSKFGVNPTDVELVNSLYNFTEFMNGKIVVREHKTDTTDKKLFFIGLEKDATDIDVTDTSLLEYLSDITNDYKKASYSYSDGTTRNGNIGFYNLGNGIKLRSWVINWTQTLAGTFYGMIDLNEAPSSASSTEGQTNTYSDPYDVSSGYSLILTFDEQSTDLGVKVRVTNETN